MSGIVKVLQCCEIVSLRDAALTEACEDKMVVDSCLAKRYEMVTNARVVLGFTHHLCRTLVIVA